MAQALLVLMAHPTNIYDPFWYSIVCYCSYALLGICPLSSYLYFLVHVTRGDSSLTACWHWMATYSLLLGGEFSLGPDYSLMDTAVS